VKLFQALIHQLRRHWVWVKWIAAIAILAWLFEQNQNALSEIDFRHLQWSYFIAGMVLTFAAFLITFTRWYYLVVSQDLPFTWRDAVRLGFIGILFNYVGPGAAGGDIVKALLIAKEHPERKAVAAATVLLDRLLGVIALFCVGALASLAFLSFAADYRWLQLLLIVLWGGAIAGVLGLFVLLHTPLAKSKLISWMFRIKLIGPVLEEIQTGVLLYQSRRHILWGAVGLSIVGHVVFLSVFYCASMAHDSSMATPGYLGHLFLVPTAELIGVLIPTPAGLGGLEAAVSGAFALGNQLSAAPVSQSIAEAAGFKTALIFRLTNILTALIGGGFYLNNRREIQEVLEEEEHVLDEETTASSPH